MIKNIIFLTFFSCLILSPVRAELYSFPKVGDAAPAPEEAQEPEFTDPFAKAVSEKMNVPEDAVEDAFERGFARTDLIRLVLLSQKSKKPLADLLKQREEGARLAAIAKENNVDNRALRAEAKKLLKEIETRAAEIKIELEAAKKKVAGVDESTAPAKTEKKNQ